MFLTSPPPPPSCVSLHCPPSFAATRPTTMNGQSLDVTLVPLGLLILAAYHLWLLRRLLKHPTRTVMGINAINRRIWVQAMMEDPAKTGVLAVQSLRNNIMASTLMASTAIMLSSLVAVLMTGGGGAWPRDGRAKVVYGDRSELGMAVRLFAILACFLLAFLFEVQSVRYYSHASILINVPAGGGAKETGVKVEYVARAISRGAWFWSLGLRAFYFSFPLFLWILGPVPMLLCCVAMVFLLYFLDVSSIEGAMKRGGDACRGREGEEDDAVAAPHAEY